MYLTITTPEPPLAPPALLQLPRPPPPPFPVFAPPAEGDGGLPAPPTERVTGEAFIVLVVPEPPAPAGPFAPALPAPPPPAPLPIPEPAPRCCYCGREIKAGQQGAGCGAWP